MYPVTALDQGDLAIGFAQSGRCRRIDRGCRRLELPSGDRLALGDGVHPPAKELFDAERMTGETGPFVGGHRRHARALFVTGLAAHPGEIHR